MQHRGACGCEVNTGDGAGILIDIPDAFLRKVAPAPLPAPGSYGVGLVFLPQAAEDRAAVEGVFARIIAEEGQQLLGWRDVPTDNSPIGPSAVRVQPVFRQIFIGRGSDDTVRLNTSETVRLKPDTTYATTDEGNRRAAFERPDVRDSQAYRAGSGHPRHHRRAAQVFLHRQPLVQHADLQRHADGQSARNDVSRSAGRRFPVGAGTGPPAIQHQHVSVLAACAPIPADRP